MKKKDLQELIRMAEHEIKEWQEFIKECKKKL